MEDWHTILHNQLDGRLNTLDAQGKEVLAGQAAILQRLAALESNATKAGAIWGALGGVLVAGVSALGVVLAR